MCPKSVCFGGAPLGIKGQLPDHAGWPPPARDQHPDEVVTWEDHPSPGWPLVQRTYHLVGWPKMLKYSSIFPESLKRFLGPKITVLFHDWFL